MRALSPALLVLACWGGTLAVAAIVVGAPERFPLVTLFLVRQDLDLDAFGLAGAAWVVVALATYLLADAACRMALPAPEPGRPPRRLNRAAHLTFAINLVLLAITCLWVASAARQAGGLGRLSDLVVSDVRGARDVLLDSKLFAGMRLCYAVLPGTACLAAALLATGRLARRARWRARAVLWGNIAALFVLPVVMSQRILLMQLVLSAWIVTCLVRGRIVGRWLAAAGALAFLVLWTLREAVSNPAVDAGVLTVAGQKLLFYVVNDLWNSFAPLGSDIPHSFGAVSFRGLAVLAFQDGTLDELTAGRMEALQAVRGGGEFSLLTAPYVDFGPVAGLVLLALLAVLLRIAHHRSISRFGWAVAYAQFGAGLLYSTHGFYATHHNMLASVLLCALILRLAEHRTEAVAAMPLESRHA